MRTHRFAAAALLCAVAVMCVFVFSTDAYAAAIPAAAHASGFSLHDVIMATPALLALRAQHADLVQKAAAKLAEVNDGLSPDAVRTIETDHAEILRQAAAVQTQIDEAVRAQPPAPVPPAPANTDAVRRAETARVQGILEVGRRGLLEQSVVDAAIADPVMTVDAFRAAAFDQLATRSAQHRLDPGHVIITRDEQETRRLGMTDAILARFARAGGERVDVPAHARAYAEMGFVEMAAECVGHRGLVRTAAAALDVVARAFHTTSDFPAIFQDATNRRLLARYQTAPATYRRFSANYMATDFRPQYVVRAGDFPTLQPVTESGEIKDGTFSESKEVFRVYPYGVGFNISRQMIINDNLNAIDQLLGSAGQRVVDWENAKVFAKLLANPPLLTDNKAVFHADHGNVAVAAAIAVASVGLGRAAMAKQTSLDGLKLNLQPTTLLTGPDKQTEAEQLLTTITPATQAAAVPESMRRIVPVGDANVGNGNKWWLFADPAIAPCFVYGYLEGFTGPRLTMQNKFGVQGVAVQLEHDFGTEAVDFRGGVYNAGA